MSALGWIVSLGSGASLAGYIALLVFAPQAALAIEKIALDLLARILSTRLGVGALVGSVSFVAGILYGDHSGAARVQAEWDAAEHAAIAAGQEARESAEREIAPLSPAEATEAPSTPAATSPHIPLFNLRADHDCSPRATPRPDDQRLRRDPHNRDHR
jgi:hypothetical protein